jgi:GT2 family glycosyltransferase
MVDKEYRMPPKSNSLDSEPRVIVAIVSTNDVRNIVGCLESLSASTHRNFRVIICENGGLKAFEDIKSTLRKLEFVSEAGPDIDGLAWITSQGQHHFALRGTRQIVSVLNAPQNLGYAGGVNACITAARNDPWDAVWVLNPDTFPNSAALAALVGHQMKGGYGIVGSRLLFNSNGLVQTWGGMRWQSWLGRARSIGVHKAAEITPDTAEVERSLAFISGASMYVSRAYIEAIGIMDEDFFVYDEDVDWCLRRGPFRLGYAHDSIVRHINGGTSGAFSSSGSRFTVYLEARNRILLARKRYGSKWAIFAAIALVNVMEHLLRSMSVRQFRFALDGWYAGVRGEKGAPKFIRQRPSTSIAPLSGTVSHREG